MTHPLRVLLVDDDEDDYVLLRSLIAKSEAVHIDLGWTARFDDALTSMGRREYDAYLVDYQLGPRTGLELLEMAITAGCHDPVILLTGHKDRELDAAALRAGAVDFISKQELSAPLLDRSIRYAVERAAGARLAAALREQKETAQVRERLLGIVGHDLRNPLASISTAAHVLALDCALPVDQRRHIGRTILSSTERMSRIIGDLLDFTRARLGAGIPVDPADIDVFDVVRSVIDEVRVAHPGRTVFVHTDGDGRVFWDPQRIGQVVSNLVGNALAHGDADAPVTVGVLGSETGLTISVHNRGTPISAERATTLFDPFQRGSADALTPASEGLGLGLYIVKEIVAGHGGRVTVESSAENGTTFAAIMPRTSKTLGRSIPSTIS
ncbi:MAG: hybrid sensor histidine kinase/response regulator [Acidobacteria bacterium]|nr:hybrid sensor histidine kinase/response regulator [Acidobacteriota bacterium]